MLEIGVIGSNSDIQVKNVINAVQFYAELLMPPEVVDNLKIDIEFDDELTEFNAHCLSEDACEDPRDFYINIKPKLKESLYCVIAHEMVHVKQYAMNELYDVFAFNEEGGLTSAVMYHGKKYSRDEGYYESPWEEEAYGKEVGLYQQWKNRKLS